MWFAQNRAALRQRYRSRYQHPCAQVAVGGSSARTPERVPMRLTGKSAICLSSPCRENISVSAEPKSVLESPPSRPSEGRIAIVTDAGWDAVDAATSGAHVIAGRVLWARERSDGAQTNGAEADGKTVWSWHPLLVSSWRRRRRPDRVRPTLIR